VWNYFEVFEELRRNPNNILGIAGLCQDLKVPLVAKITLNMLRAFAKYQFARINTMKLIK
jgi:hypothetical protein